MFGKLFTSEFPDANVFNIITIGVKSPRLVTEAAELGFSCVKNQNSFSVKIIDDVLLLGGNSLDDLGGDKFIFKVLDFLLGGLDIKNTN